MSKPKLNTFARVRALTGWRAIAFSAALLERMVPNYHLFCELTDYEHDNICQKCLSLIWETLKAPKTKVNFSVQLEKVEDVIPDPADYDNFGVFPAVDAGMALAATINLILDVDPQGAVVVSKLSQGSVEAYLLASGEADDDTVKQHPLMEFEVALQNELLDVVEGQGKANDIIDKARKLALEENMSNIGIEL